MLSETFAVVGACLGFSAGLLYALSAWRGRVDPSRVTWTLWTAIPLIIFAASVSKGAGLQSLFTLSAGLGPGFVVLVILFRRHTSYWKLSRLDLELLHLVAVGDWTLDHHA